MATLEIVFAQLFEDFIKRLRNKCMVYTCEELSDFFYTFSYATIYSISLQLFAKNLINGICFFMLLPFSKI